MVMYAVIYASAGCLPDSEFPEFVGTYDECVQFVQENGHDYERPEVEHDLYALEIVDVDDDYEYE